MNWKAWLPLAVAIVLGLFAARMAMNLTGSKSDEDQAPKQTVQVVVAARDIEPGTSLNDLDVKVATFDAATVPAGTFPAPGAVAKRVTKIALTTNQPILPTLLAEEGAGSGAASTLPKGFRAITVEINDVSGVAGFIQPSCRVDIVATIQADGKPLAKTVLENITVFAVGGRTNPNPEPPQPGQPPEQARTVTLLVTPEQAEKLELATSSARVRMVLRNGKDAGTSGTNGVTIAELKGDSRNSSSDPFATTQAPLTNTSYSTTQPSSTASSDFWTVEIIRAGATSTQTFQVPVKPQQPEQNTKTDPTSITDTTDAVQPR